MRQLRRKCSFEDFLHSGSTAHEGASLQAAAHTEASLRETIQTELSRYAALAMWVEKGINPGEWWKQPCLMMPNVSLIARWFLGIPPSTASLDRLFSAAGRAITRRRPNLTGKRGSQLIYGHANVVRGTTGMADLDVDGDARGEGK